MCSSDLDFGPGVLLRKKLSVDVGSLERHRQIRAQRFQLQLTRWTDCNAVVVYRDARGGVPASAAKYPMPDADELSDLCCEEDGPLTESNYVRQMHGMLSLEELARMQLVSRYALTLWASHP